MRAISATAATFGAAAKNAVTGVGAPSYTSGVHMWNGAADILKAQRAEHQHEAEDEADAAAPSPTAAAMASKRIEPVKP
jgi:hypothetical protein